MTARKPKPHKKRGPAKGTGGRPVLKIDWENVASLARIHCTHEEVASILNVDVDTLHNRGAVAFAPLSFSEWYAQKRQGGKASLRRRMFQKAIEGGDNTMLIWLSKQHLGMSDKQVNVDLPADQYHGNDGYQDLSDEEKLALAKKGTL